MRVELPSLPWVDARYGVRERCVAGASMGGYGALRMAWRAPERFVAAAGMSSAVFWGDPDALRVDWVRRMADHVYPGDPARFVQDALLPMARPGPRVRLDCGRDDFLLDDNRRFVAALRAKGVPFSYEEPPGGHDWGYWDARLDEVVQFCVTAPTRPPAPA